MGNRCLALDTHQGGGLGQKGHRDGSQTDERQQQAQVRAQEQQHPVEPEEGGAAHHQQVERIEQTQIESDSGYI